jgi:hypothetical protein
MSPFRPWSQRLVDPFDALLRRLPLGRGSQRRPAGDQPMRDRTEGEDVRPLVGGLSPQLLRRSIGGSGFLQRQTAGQPSPAEVGDLDARRPVALLRLQQKDLARIERPVHRAASMHLLEHGGQGVDQRRRVGRRDPRAGGEQLDQRLPGGKLPDREQPAIGQLAGGKQADHPGLVDRGETLCFLPETRDIVVLEQTALDHPHHHLATVDRIDRAEDGPRASRVEVLSQTVAADGGARRRLLRAGRWSDSHLRRILRSREAHRNRSS